MQLNTTSVQRGALLLSGVAAVAICFYGYSYFSQPSITQSGAKLHRSNAMHGRRRRGSRSRPIPQSVQNNHDPLAVALEQLAEAEEAGLGFGLFDNTEYLTPEFKEARGDTLVLLPTRLDYICDTIVEELHLSQEEADRLRADILTSFMSNFIKTTFPQGYYIAGDAAALQQALAPTIDPHLVKNFMETYYPLEGGFVGSNLSGIPDADGPLPSVEHVAQALSGNEDTRPSQLHEQWGQTGEQGEGHQILDLLYRIGEEQAKRNGYQHRGVQCNGCGMQPITGIRYHCANCWDYDLCEMCEAQQIHLKTHVFYKIRIPAPTRGQIKLVQPKWYPGEPNSCPESIPEKLKEQLLKTTNLDRQELDAFYDQFRCIAGKIYSNDPDGIGMAIDRPGFDRYFTSTTADRAPNPNLIYDRIFSFYDSDGDDLISFAEYAKGMAELAYNKTRKARIQRLFAAFDINKDGYVDRRDFLHLLQAHYSLSKEVAHEMIYARYDVPLTDEEMQEVIQGNNPISAAFGGSSFAEHRSRHGVGKHIDMYGDLIRDDNRTEVLKEDSQMLGNRAQAIARQASDSRPPFITQHVGVERTSRDDPVMAGYFELPSHRVLERFAQNEDEGSEEQGYEDIDRLRSFHHGQWPNHYTDQTDVVEALGTNIPLEEIMDPMDRRRVLQAQRERLWTETEANNLETGKAAIEERWQRRRFYLDEEQGLRPPAAYNESDSSDDDLAEDEADRTKVAAAEHGGRRTSLRSRSSSKVRFDDSAIQSEIETKSDASSRNTPINERWGGFEFSQPDRDIGVEIIYEAVQEAFNDMLNHFFKEKEDQCMAARATRAQRARYKMELEEYERGISLAAQKKEQALIDADMERTNVLLNLLQTETVNTTVGEERESGDHKEDLGIINHSAESSVKDKPPSSKVWEESPIPDPTLPQNRPNDDQVQSDLSESPQPGRSLITLQLLQLWHEHNLVDREAQVRKGYGRLNIKEFKRKLQEKDTDDIDIGAEGDEDEEHYWEAKADLGKWSFLSSWIEMGSF